MNTLFDGLSGLFRPYAEMELGAVWRMLPHLWNLVGVLLGFDLMIGGPSASGWGTHPGFRKATEYGVLFLAMARQAAELLETRPDQARPTKNQRTGSDT